MVQKKKSQEAADVATKPEVQEAADVATEPAVQESAEGSGGKGNVKRTRILWWDRGIASFNDRRRIPDEILEAYPCHVFMYARNDRESLLRRQADGWEIVKIPQDLLEVMHGRDAGSVPGGPAGDWYVIGDTVLMCMERDTHERYIAHRRRLKEAATLNAAAPIVAGVRNTPIIKKLGIKVDADISAGGKPYGGNGS